MNLDVVRDQWLQLKPPPISTLLAEPSVPITASEADPPVGGPISDALRTARERESRGDLIGAAEAYWDLALQVASSDAFILVSVAYFKAGEYARSVSAARKALGAARKARRLGRTRKPESDFQAHFILALADTLMDKPLSALRHITHSIRLSPDDAAAHLILGHIRIQLEQWTAAVSAFEDALRLGTEDQKAYLFLANLYANLADEQPTDQERNELLRKALAIYKRYLTQFPNEASQAHNSLGVLHGRLGEIEAAIQEYQAAVRTDRGNVLALNNLARAYLALDRLAEAEAAFGEAALALQGDAEATPPDVASSILEGHAILLVKMHELAEQRTDLLAEAESAFLTAIELDPKSPNARNNLGGLYAKLGRLYDAENQFKKVLEIESGNEFARSALSEIAIARNSADPPDDHKAKQGIGETLRLLRELREAGDEHERRDRFGRLKRAMEEIRLSGEENQGEFEKASESLSSRLERAGITQSALESSLPEARARIVAKLYPGIAHLLEDEASNV